MADKLQYLLDRAEITEVVIRIFNGFDLRDWVDLHNALADHVRVDTSAVQGDPPTTMAAEAFVDYARDILSGFQATQHMSTNHVLAIDGDQARVTSYMFATHWIKTDAGAEDSYTARGCYALGLVRTDRGWRLSHFELRPWHEDGNKGVYEIAAARWRRSQQEAK